MFHGAEYLDVVDMIRYLYFIDPNCDVLPIEYDVLILIFVNINITLPFFFFLTPKMSCHQQYVTFQSFACVLFSLFCMVT